MNVMILDAGNSIIKCKTATRETAVPHAIKTLAETEYEQILLRAGGVFPSRDYLGINGVPYVVGESDEPHGTLTRRSRALRYRQDYFDILEVVTSFERSFLANHRDAVRDTPILPPDRVPYAIRSGVFVGGGRSKRRPPKVVALM